MEMQGASHGVTIQLPEQVNHLLRLHFDGAERVSCAGVKGKYWQDENVNSAETQVNGRGEFSRPS